MSELVQNPSATALMLVAEMLAAKEFYDLNRNTEDYEFLCEKHRALESYIAELEAIVKGHDPFEDFPSKERGFECSVVVLGKFEYEDEFNPITNLDLCVYWFDEERWHPLNGYVAGDDIVKWYSLPEEREE